MTLDIQTARVDLDGARLDVQDVEVTLDRTWSPYVQGVVTVAGLLADLDPDTSPEPRVAIRFSQRFAVGLTAAEIAASLAPASGSTIAGGAWGGMTGAEIAASYETNLNPEPIAPRSLYADLMVRDVELDLVEGVTRIVVASDDARLWDAARVDTSPEPFSGASIRDVVESILSRVGAVLEAGSSDGALDADPILNPGIKYRDFLSPLLQATGLRLYATERRRFRLVPIDEVDDTATVELSTSRDVSGATPRIDRERGGFDSVVIEYRWIQSDGTQRVQYDVAGPTRPRKTHHIVYGDTPYPGPGAAAQVLARIGRRRREIPVEAAANYDARPTMTVTLSTLAIGRQAGRLARVVFGFPARTMRADLYDLETVSPISTRAIPEGIQTDQLPGTTNTLDPRGL